jgi:hypothetical protein
VASLESRPDGRAGSGPHRADRPAGDIRVGGLQDEAVGLLAGHRLDDH